MALPGDGIALRLDDPGDDSILYDAGDDRAAFTALMTPGGAGIAARAGRRPGAFALSVGGSPEAVTVPAYSGIVTDPDGGAYICAFPNAATKTLATRPGSGTSRIDLVVAHIYDADVHADTTLREPLIEVIAGNAAAAPVAPTQPSGTLLLGTLTVPATGSVAVNNNGPRTVAVGGILPVANQAERDALTAYDGLMVYREDTDTFEGHVGGAWSSLSSGPELELHLGSDQDIPNATTTDITNWTGVRNVGGMWTSGKTVTITKPGLHALGVTAQWAGAAAGAVAVGILVNGNPIRWQGGQDFVNNESNQKSTDTVKRLAAGDKVTFQVQQNSGGTLTLQSASGAETTASVLWLRD